MAVFLVISKGIGFGAMDDQSPCEFIGFGAMDDQLSYEFWMSRGSKKPQTL